MAVIGKPVTVRRYGMDRYGDRTVLATSQVAGCAFAPKISVEVDDRSTAVTADAEIYMPGWAEIMADDEIELSDGTRWEVHGEPEYWESPFDGWNPGQMVPLRKSRG